jgi:hypothetical protein
MTRRPSTSAAKPLLGILFLLMGVGAAVLSIPWLIRVIPHDAARSGTILEALRGGGTPEMVVFGSSVAMSSVDTRLLGAELARGSGAGRAPVIYNLGSEGQYMAEAGMMYQELPASVHTIVQLVDPSQDLSARQHIWPGKYTALYMYGYRPAPATRAVMTSVYGAPMRAQFARSTLSYHAEARWVVRRGLDIMVHRALRRDLEFRRYENDLFFPSIYTHATSRPQLDAGLAEALRPVPGRPARTTPEAVAMLTGLCRLATLTRPSRRVVFVLQPGHPALAGLRMPDAVERLRDVARSPACGGRARVVDAMLRIRAEDFADERHPLPSGAEPFTRWLAGRLRAGG